MNEKVVFICTDESYHEVSEKSGFENCIRSKKTFVETYSKFQDVIEFSIMQWDVMSTEIRIELCHNWKAKTKKKKKEINVENIIANQKRREEIEQKRKNVEISDTRIYKKFTVSCFSLFLNVSLTNNRRQITESMRTTQNAKREMRKVTKGEKTGKSSINTSRWMI